MKTLEQHVEAYGLEWDAFADVLDDMDKEAFARLMHRAKRHAEASSKKENPNMFESVVFSILVDHQRELALLQDRLLPVETKTCPRCGRTSPVEDFVTRRTNHERVGILCGRCREGLGFGGI
jgi:hypothetical protein